MSAFIRYLPAAAPLLLPWVIHVATWLVARALNMPAPLVEAAGLFLFLKAQSFENRVGKSLCPIGLRRRLHAMFSEVS